MIKKLGGSIGLVLLLVVGGGFWIYDKFNGNDSENDKAGEVGDCLAVEDAMVLDDKAEQVDCKDQTATYVITGEGEKESACDANELTYQLDDGEGETWFSCLWPNVADGDCLTGDSVPLKVECSAGEARLTVALVDDSSADESQCPKQSQPLVNTKREKLLCLGPAA